jgi:hypothetical protein
VAEGRWERWKPERNLYHSEDLSGMNLNKGPCLAALALVFLLVIGCAVPGNYGDGYGNSSGSSDPPRRMIIQCPSCSGGSGACGMCNGSGISCVDPKRRDRCGICYGSGVCTRCRGRGKIAL